MAEKKTYNKMQVLIPLRMVYDGMSTGEFVDILKCNRGTCRTILLELKAEGLVSETGVQKISYNAKTKQNTVQNNPEGKNNKNPWKITDKGQKLIKETVEKPIEDDDEILLVLLCIHFRVSTKLVEDKLDWLIENLVMAKKENGCFELTNFGYGIIEDYASNLMYPDCILELSLADSLTLEQVKYIYNDGDFSLKALKATKLIEKTRDGKWCVTAERLDYILEWFEQVHDSDDTESEYCQYHEEYLKLCEKRKQMGDFDVLDFIDILTVADFDWLLELYNNGETTIECEHVFEMEKLGWIIENNGGEWEITSEGEGQAELELEQRNEPEDEDDEPIYSEVALKIMSCLSGSFSYTVAGLARETGLSRKIIKAELLDMDSKNAAFQQDNGEWCLTMEAEDYWNTTLCEKLIDKLKDADFDWLANLYTNGATTIGCEHTEEMERLQWIIKDIRCGEWKITSDGCEHAVTVLEEKPEEPIVISVDMLTFDEIDDKPILRFANETVNGWIEIEEFSDEKDVMLVFHTDSTAQLDFTEFLPIPFIDGTRKLRVNRKVAYAFFKMILEKPVLQCGIDESEDLTEL